jgi:hypothetical protein
MLQAEVFGHGLPHGRRAEISPVMKASAPAAMAASK